MWFSTRLHGRFGEDGVIQGVLDWLGIPYTHSGVRASALAMDKAASRAVFAAATACSIARGRGIDHCVELISHRPIRCRCPYVIKPLNEGSSVGVEILREGTNRRHGDRAGMALRSRRLWSRNSCRAAN